MAMVSEVNSNLLEMFPAFKTHFSSKSMKKILEFTEEKHYLHEETLYSAD